MKEVNVDLPLGRPRSYKICVGTGLLGKISSLYDIGRYSKVFILTDETVQSLLLEELVSSLSSDTASLQLPAGEKHKDIVSVQKIWTAMHAAGCDRQSLVINLGGGVVSDLGSFAASTYMRGVDFLNVPTTLLSQADAGIGGKTGFNFDGVKNLVGTFSQPIGILVDTKTLDTLPDREFVSGFGEIIKHGIIRDKDHFEKVTAKRPRDFSADELSAIIAQSCRIKSSVVHDDEAEGGKRKLLNFGHTVGHAIEALSLDTGNHLLHGEAVSIGMVAEADIAVRLNILQAADLERIRRALKAAGLPVAAKGFSTEDILKKMQSDKKNSGGKLNFTLIDGIGHAIYDQEVPSPVVTEAIQAILD